MTSWRRLKVSLSWCHELPSFLVGGLRPRTIRETGNGSARGWAEQAEVVAVGSLDIGEHQAGVSHRLGADQDRAAELGDLAARGGYVGDDDAEDCVCRGSAGWGLGHSAGDRASGDPAADLRALVNDRCLAAAEKPDLVPGLISAMRSEPGIEDAVKAGYNLEHVRSAIARTHRSRPPAPRPAHRPHRSNPTPTCIVHTRNTRSLR